jgi:hypothetical protein
MLRNRKGYHRRIYQLKLVIHARNPHGYWLAEHLLERLLCWNYVKIVNAVTKIYRQNRMKP